MLQGALDLRPAAQKDHRAAEPVQKAQLHVSALHGHVGGHHRGLPRGQVQQADGLAGVILPQMGADVQPQVLIDPPVRHADELGQRELLAHHPDPDRTQLPALEFLIPPGEYRLQELLPCHTLPHRRASYRLVILHTTYPSSSRK